MNANDLVFPEQLILNDLGHIESAGAYNSNTGMTIRTYIATAAMNGIKSNPELCRICSDVPGMTQAQAIARMAVCDADALIAALNSIPTPEESARKETK